MNSGALVWQFGLLILVLLAAAVVVLVLGSFLKRRSQDGSGGVVFRDLAPSDLSRLKSKGLLTDEEAKRLQAVIAKKTLESMEKRTQPSVKRLDVQDLLSEVERLRLKHLQERAESPEEKE